MQGLDFSVWLSGARILFLYLAFNCFDTDTKSASWRIYFDCLAGSPAVKSLAYWRKAGDSIAGNIRIAGMGQHVEFTFIGIKVADCECRSNGYNVLRELDGIHIRILLKMI
jgi:hypothetical protein